MTPQVKPSPSSGASEVNATEALKSLGLQDTDEVDLDKFEDALIRQTQFVKDMGYDRAKLFFNGMISKESGGREDVAGKNPRGVLSRGRWQISDETAGSKYQMDNTNPVLNRYMGVHYWNEGYERAKEISDDPRVRAAIATSYFHHGPRTIEEMKKNGGQIPQSWDGGITTNDHVFETLMNWKKGVEDAGLTFDLEDGLDINVGEDIKEILPPVEDTTSSRNFFTGTLSSSDERNSAPAPDPRASVERLKVAFSPQEQAQYATATPERRKDMLLGTVADYLVKSSREPTDTEAILTGVTGKSQFQASPVKITRKKAIEALGYIRGMNPEEFDTGLGVDVGSLDSIDLDTAIPRLVKAYQSGGLNALADETIAVKKERATLAREEKARQDKLSQELAKIVEDFKAEKYLGSDDPIDRMALSSFSESILNVEAGAAGLGATAAQKLGLDSLDRALSEFSKAEYEKVKTIQEWQEVLKRDSNVPSVVMSGAKLLGQLPMLIGSVAAGGSTGVYATTLAQNAKEEPLKAITLAVENSILLGLGAGVGEAGTKEMLGLGVRDTLANTIQMSPDFAKVVATKIYANYNPGKITPEEQERVDKQLRDLTSDLIANLLVGGGMLGLGAIGKIPDTRIVKVSDISSAINEAVGEVSNLPKTPPDYSALGGVKSIEHIISPNNPLVDEYGQPLGKVIVSVDKRNVGDDTYYWANFVDSTGKALEPQLITEDGYNLYTARLENIGKLAQEGKPSEVAKAIVDSQPLPEETGLQLVEKILEAEQRSQSEPTLVNPATGEPLPRKPQTFYGYIRPSLLQVGDKIYNRETLSYEPVTAEGIAKLTEEFQAKKKFADEPDFITEQRFDAEDQGKFGMGADLLPKAIALGYDFYRAGMEFKDWIIEMQRQTAKEVWPYLESVWEKLLFLDGTKVRDDNGPIKVYHGTQSYNPIREINTNYLDEGALYGPGFYMTEDPYVASLYSKNKSSGTTPYEAIVEHFKPGNIVESYGGGRDKVLEFYPITETSDWSVKVQAVDAEGNPLKGMDGKPRVHHTSPDAKKFGRPHAYSFYVNIKNPLDMNAQVGADRLPTIKAAVDTWLGEGSRIGLKLKETTKWGDLYEELVDAEMQKGEITEMIKEMGYDGITHIGGRFRGDRDHRVWIAFKPEQVLNTLEGWTPRNIDGELYSPTKPTTSTPLRAQRGEGGFIDLTDLFSAVYRAGRNLNRAFIYKGKGIRALAGEQAASLYTAAISAGPQTKAMLLDFAQQATPLLDKLGSNVKDYYMYRAQDRLEGVRQRYYSWATSALTLSADDLISSFVSNSGGQNFHLALSEMHKRQPKVFPEPKSVMANLRDAVDSGDFSGIRTQLHDLFSTAGNIVTTDVFPDYANYRANNRLDQVNSLYRTIVETPLRIAFQETDAVPSTSLGNDNLYYPLIAEIDNLQGQREARPQTLLKRALFQKPKSPAARFTTGLGDTYTTSLEEAQKTMTKQLLTGNRAGVIQGLLDTQVARPLERVPDPITGGWKDAEIPEGYSTIEAGPYRVFTSKVELGGIKGTKTFSAPSKTLIAPTEVVKDITAFLKGEDFVDTNVLLKVSGAITKFAIKGLLEPVYHSWNVVDGLRVNLGYLPTDIFSSSSLSGQALAKLANGVLSGFAYVPGPVAGAIRSLRQIPVVGRVASQLIDPRTVYSFAKAMEQNLFSKDQVRRDRSWQNFRELLLAGSVPERIGETTYSPRIGNFTGAELKGPLQWKPIREMLRKLGQDVPEPDRVPGQLSEDNIFSGTKLEPALSLAKKTLGTFSLTPAVFGWNGLDLRARMASAEALKHYQPDITPFEMFERLSLLGIYNRYAESTVGSALKRAGVAPFYSAASARFRRDFQSFTRLYGAKSTQQKEAGSDDPARGIAYRAATLLSESLYSYITMWAITHHASTGLWPWEDDTSKLLQMKIGRDEITKSYFLSALNPDPTKDAYVSFVPQFGGSSAGTMFGFDGLYKAWARLEGIETVTTGDKVRLGASIGKAQLINSMLHIFAGGPMVHAGTRLAGVEPSVYYAPSSSGGGELKILQHPKGGSLAHETVGFLFAMNSMIDNVGDMLDLSPNTFKQADNPWHADMLKFAFQMATHNGIKSQENPYMTRNTYVRSVVYGKVQKQGKEGSIKVLEQKGK